MDDLKISNNPICFAGNKHLTTISDGSKTNSAMGDDLNGQAHQSSGLLDSESAAVFRSKQSMVGNQLQNMPVQYNSAVQHSLSSKGPGFANGITHRILTLMICLIHVCG